MNQLTIVSDTHVGAQRSGGTTPFTAWQLRQYLLECFRNEVATVEGDLCILGDLFDTGAIPMQDLLETWAILREWLSAKGRRLYMVTGNHDRLRDLRALSSFQFLCKLLTSEFPAQVQEVDDTLYVVDHGVFIVASSPNQDLFNEALKKCPPCFAALVHANYDNKFAVESDHSLNLSPEQAMNLPAQHVVFAHEHQQRSALNGKVVIVGNQFPSSISDCLGNDAKRRAVITDKSLTFETTWTASGEFEVQDWQALDDNGAKFIRVAGKATAEQAAEVVTAIAKFRNKAKALVITNAVEIEGIGDQEQIQVTLEQVKSFDVLSALLECLDEREQGVVKGLLNAKQSH